MQIVKRVAVIIFSALCLILFATSYPIVAGNPFSSSGSEYPRWTAFTGVRWMGDQPTVQVDDQWYEPLSIHGVPITKIIQHSKDQRWDTRKRFEEDLVQMLRLMGHNIGRTTTLVLRDETGEVITMKNFKMTEENRRKVKARSSLSLPDLEQVIERLRQNEAALQSASVKLTHTRVIRFMQPADKPLRGFFVGTWRFHSDGRARYDGVVEESTTYGDVKKTCSAAFDGTVARRIELYHNDGTHTAAIEGHLVHYGMDPRELTTRHFAKNVSERLAENGDEQLRRDELDGRSVLVVDTMAVDRGNDYKTRYWIDPQRGYSIVRRASLIRLEGEDRWQEYAFMSSLDLKEVEPGLWLPTKLRYESLEIAKGKEPSVAWQYQGKASNWQVNAFVDDDLFVLEIPKEVAVSDLRPQEEKDK